MTSLLLSDGTIFKGQSFGANVDCDGEVVFNTGMAGYPESMTDPSYRGQILVTTYPLIGNYGVPSEELNDYGFSKNLESEDIHIRGLVVQQVSDTYSHHAAVCSLQDWMKQHGIPGITGIDTRALTKHLRERGVMLGKIVQSDDVAIGDISDPNKNNLVSEVSIKQAIAYDPNPNPNPNPITILAYDCGMKRNILRSFLSRGINVVRVPWDFDIDLYEGKLDGVFISNGPGDPKTCVPTINAIKKAIAKNIPTFGICLGNQLMALAIGGDTYKLPYGHRGVNQPCVEVCHPELVEGSTRAMVRRAHHDTRGSGIQKCIITSQNHGFAVKEELPAGWHVWWKNANDGTVEGIRHDSGRFFAVQFHPEATPGPEDANYLFDEFCAVMERQKGQ